MEYLIKEEHIVTHRGTRYKYNGFEPIANDCVHLKLGDELKLFFAGDTEINGVTCNSAEEILINIQK